MAESETNGDGPSGSMCSRTRPLAGVRANVSSSGRSARRPCSIAAPSSSEPSAAPSMTTTERPWRNGGRSGIGGRRRIRNDVLMASGALGAQALHSRSTGSASATSHSSIPA